LIEILANMTTKDINLQDNTGKTAFTYGNVKYFIGKQNLDIYFISAVSYDPVAVLIKGN
jgi:hypothetical protein